jgi:hypothetical protein
VSPPLEIGLTRQAQAQIEEASAWWAENYRVTGKSLEVLAFWHISRGQQPKL